MHDFDPERLTLEDVLEELGSGRPVPGGGSGAAIAAALGASLVGMLARVSLHKSEHASHHRLLEAVAEGAEETRRRLLRLARQDANAYRQVTEAYGMPRHTDDEKAARKAAIQSALRGATDVPLQVMEQCVEAIGLAKNAVECGNQNAAADGATGAEICRAALKGAAFNVRVNLATVEDETYVKLCRTRMDEMLYMGTRVATGIESFVNDLWK